METKTELTAHKLGTKTVVSFRAISSSATITLMTAKTHKAFTVKTRAGRLVKKTYAGSWTSVSVIARGTHDLFSPTHTVKVKKLPLA
jgi:hypothetical protein